MTARRRWIAVAALIAAAAWPAVAASQTLQFGSDGDDLPVAINADDGIEWQHENMVFRARGNAHAKRGDVDVQADVLSAHYREREDGSTEIWRLDAEGSVRISSPTETAFAEKGIYDVDNGIMVLSGGNRVRFVAESHEITADRQLEYWQNKQMAVARGNALAVRGENRLRADVLAAYFRRAEKGDSTIERVEAFDNVEVTTADEVVQADYGVYNVVSGIATLTGSVSLTRGVNRLDGCSAEINLETGVSTLHACGGAGQPRVRGVFHPERRKGN